MIYDGLIGLFCIDERMTSLGSPGVSVFAYVLRVLITQYKAVPGTSALTRTDGAQRGATICRPDHGSALRRLRRALPRDNARKA